MNALRRVLVTSRSFGSGSRAFADELEAEGIEVVVGPSDHEATALADLLPEIDGWIAGVAPITESHLRRASRLRIIARYGVGVDSVDLRSASARHILVTNTPGANSGAVADHTIALMLASLRSVTAGDRRVRAGNWTVDRARELGSLTVGVVGMGRIGRGVVSRLSGFAPTILGIDPGLTDAQIRSAGAEPSSMGGIVERSDVITLHVPGDQSVVDRKWLDSVKPGLILVNTARADLVDEADLCAALRSNIVCSYAADTLSGEGGSAESPLLCEDLVDRVILTPHSAAQTVEAVDLMGAGATEAILAVHRGKEPPNIVNDWVGAR